MKTVFRILVLVLIFSLAACYQKQGTAKSDKEVFTAKVKTDTSSSEECDNYNDVVIKNEDTHTSAAITKSTNTIESTEYDKYMAKAMHLKNKTISSSFIDYDKDNKKEKVQIILDEGYFHEDDEMWSGQGPKWVGTFSVHVLKEGKDVFSTSLNKLLNPGSDDSIFFYSPEFQLSFYDYNSDEKMDFVLSQYFSTNGCEYYPFTIDIAGKVERLEIEGKYAFFVSPMNRENSILLPYEENKIIASYYDNTEGSYYKDYYGWNVGKKKFVLEKRVTDNK